MIEERNKGGPFRDLMDFCTRVDGSKVNRRVLEGLIQCGAFDFTGVERSRLLASLEEVTRLCGAGQDPNQLTIFSAVQGGGARAFDFSNLPNHVEWDEREKLRREKEALGFYITGHPLDRYREEVRRFTTCSIQDLGLLTDKTTVRVAGVIEELKIKRTKRGDKMAVLTLEDQTGSTEVVVFPDVFERSSALLKSDDPLLVSGTAEVDEMVAKIITQEIQALENVKQEAIRLIELSLTREALSKDHLEGIKDVLYRYPGQSSVVFKVETDPGKRMVIAAHPRYNVFACREMIEELETLIGRKVVCHYGEKTSNHRLS
jgi:DNA polymerase-3 subunit alpha